jgi:preprotein translocase subunit YajC
MLISPAYAQAAPAAGDGLLVSLLPLVLIFVVFYFLLIRPQQQKVKQHRAMIEALKKGDQVLTGGGIIGRVTRVEADNTLSVEIAPNTVVKVERGTVSALLTKPAPASNENQAAAKPAAGGGGLFGRMFSKK